MGGRRREKDLESQLEEAKAVIAALISGWEESLTRTAAAPRLVREARAALAGSEARFRALVENTSDAIALLGPEGHVSYVSPAITTMLGHRPTDLTGKPGLAFLHPVDRKRMRKLFARSIWEGAVLLRDEVRARHADGSWRNLELSIVSWLEDAERGCHCRHPARHHRPQAVGVHPPPAGGDRRSSDDAIIGTTLNGVITSWDHGAGMTYDELVVEDERDASLKVRASLLEEGTIAVANRHLRPADGAIVPVDISAAVVRVGDVS